MNAVQIDTVRLETADGLSLVGDVHHPENEPQCAVLIAHPHPQFGGDRFNTVVDAIFRTLPDHGVTALRFDFRGVNESTGEYGGGVEERLDVEAAVDYLSAFAVPVVAVGYSFGGATVLQCADARLSAWCAIAPPLRADAVAPSAAGDQRPKLLLVPQYDQFATPDSVNAITRSWSNTIVLPIEMTDHFIGGRTSFVAGQVAGFVSMLL